MPQPRKRPIKAGEKFNPRIHKERRITPPTAQGELNLGKNQSRTRYFEVGPLTTFDERVRVPKYLGSRTPTGKR